MGQLQEQETVRNNKKNSKTLQAIRKSDMEAYRTRNQKVVVQKDGQVFPKETVQRTIERELPDDATKHDPIITSMKASHLFNQFEGMGDIDEAGFMFDQHAIGDLKNKMYKMRRQKER